MSQEINIEKDSMIWKNKKSITWTDSTGEIINAVNFKCEIFSSYTAVKDKKNLSQPSRVKVGFDYDRKHSYTINLNIASDDFMYSQTILNIYQLYARKLRKACYQIKFKPGYYGIFESTFAEYFSQLSETDNLFRIDTENGKNNSKLKDWSSKIEKELESLEVNEKSPK
jgi:hypothetical protein